VEDLVIDEWLKEVKQRADPEDLGMGGHKLG
jgi:hypothetical protein